MPSGTIHPWNDVEAAPVDPILEMAEAYRLCTNQKKVDVCVGAYCDESGKPWVLPSVRLAEQQLLTENKEYLPMEGDPVFVKLALQFAYGSTVDLSKIAAVQSLSGTGALRLGAEFLAKFYKDHSIYVSSPTWENHWAVLSEADLNINTYRYYDEKRHSVDTVGMLEDLEAAPNGSVVLLQVCAHNPTGMDPTKEEWKQVLNLVHAKGFVAFFDFAYQGFASGDANSDAQPLREAIDLSIPIIMAQSFSKNFGLYGERCGTLSITCLDSVQQGNVRSQLKDLIRSMYATPPKHGSGIVRTILSDEILTKQFLLECGSIAYRIRSMREALVEALANAGSSHDWSHLTQQIGMFAYTGLTAEMCDALTNEYGIFLPRYGRLSIAGLNDGNIEYVAMAIHIVTKGKKIRGE